MTNLTQLERTVADNGEATDVAWIILSTFIIFTMQSGFGLLESGMVSSKNEANVMVKNMLDVTLGGIAYWFIGYGFSFGSNGNAMSGNGNFLTDVELKAEERKLYARYIFQLSFATTATTIVSGAVAERVNLKAYMIFAIINTGIIYPFPAHWVWDSTGWLAELGAFDFAGSSVVHMAGGASAFAACVILGPRYGRFGKNKSKFYMASPTNVVLGTFFLWWGWIGFNCGSTFGVSGGLWMVASRTAVVTMNGAMGGGLSGVLLSMSLMHRRHYLLDIPQFSSGVLGGLVGITAIASACRPWEGLVIGFIGGLIANGFIALLNKLKIDDPVGCIGIHWAAGFWSMIAVGFFAEVDAVVGLAPEAGIFRGGKGHLLASNIAAAVSITVWSGGCTAIVIFVLKYTMGFRMPLQEELRGSDEVEHNIVDDDIELRYQNHALGRRVSRIERNVNKLGDRNVNEPGQINNAVKSEHAERSV